jgi:uncharacterized membrane protein
LNVVGWIHAWNPYPFILLNLTLSFQAAYTALILMMSQNREVEIDRRRPRSTTASTSRRSWRSSSYTRKFDLLREQRVMQLLQAVELLLQRLNSAERREASS